MFKLKIFQTLFFACVFMFSTGASALSFRGSEYDVFLGDANSDGIQDVYLAPKEIFVLIPGEISIPLFVDSQDPHYLIASVSGVANYYKSPVVTPSLDVSGFVKSGHVVSLQDKDGDGIDDVTFSDPSLLYTFAVSTSALQALEINYSEFSAPPMGSVGVDPTNHLSSSDEYWGALRGSHQVGSDGSFNYTVKIEVPPGINGMQPELALIYNSNKDNGLLGWGWSLETGYPKIQRCKADYARDGERSGVNPGENYKYCWGVERLVEVGQGEYRTEEEVFSRITRMGGSERAPQEWQVITKKGLKISFGKNNATDMDGQGDFYAWHPTQIMDVFGNYMEFVYERPSSNELRLKRIEYTKNTTMQDINQKIELQYEARQDSLVAFVAGNQEETSQRLSALKTYADTHLVKQYLIDYEQLDGINYADPAAGSRIVEIKECSSDSTHCKTPLVFEWNKLGDSELQFDTSTPDFAMDAMDDFGSAFYPDYKSEPAPFGHSIVKEYSVRGDFDGDGKKEIAYWECDNQRNPGNCRHYVKMERGVNSILFEANAPSIQTHRIEEQWEGSGLNTIEIPDRFYGGVIDVNGDGRDDYYITSHRETAGYRFYVSDGRTLVRAPEYDLKKEDLTRYLTMQWNTGRESTPWYKTTRDFSLYYEFADINGDNLVDVLVSPFIHSDPNDLWDNFLGFSIHERENGIYVALNTGNGFNSFSRWGTATDYHTALYAIGFTKGARELLDLAGASRPTLVDVNGDGLLDILGFMPGIGIEVGLNDGTQFVYQDDWSEWTVGRLIPADVEWLDNDQEVFLCPSRVDDVNGDPIDGARIYNYVGNLFRYGDVNGDGLTDIVFLDHEGVKVSFSSGNSYRTPILWSSELDWEFVTCGIESLIDNPRPDEPIKFESDLDYVLGRHVWGLLDANDDGLADINIKVENNFERGAQTVTSVEENFKIMLSSGDKFSTPIEVHTEQYANRWDDYYKAKTFVEVGHASSGELFLRRGNIQSGELPDRRRSTAFEESWDGSALGPPISDFGDRPWGMYKSQIAAHKLLRIIEADRIVTQVDYANILSDPDVYVSVIPAGHKFISLTGVQERSISETGNAIGHWYNSYGERKLRFGGVHVANKRAVHVVKKIESNLVDYQGDEHPQKISNYKYRNYRQHTSGFGNLGFETVYQQDQVFAVSGYRYRQEKRYIQEVGDGNDYLLRKPREIGTCIVVTSAANNTIGCLNPDAAYDPDVYRVSYTKKNWKVKLLNFDIDGYPSPHYYPYLLEELEERHEWTDSNNDVVTTRVKRLYQDGVTTSCPAVTTIPENQRTTNTTHVDFKGTPLYITESHCDAFGVAGVEISNAQRLHDLTNWCLGLVQRPIARSWNYDAHSNREISSTSETSFKFENCAIKSQTREPNSADDRLWLETDFVYDGYGKTQLITETGRSFTNDGVEFSTRQKSSNNVYSSNGTLTQTLFNYAGHQTIKVIEPEFGNLKSQTDANGKTYSFINDEFGRVQSQTIRGVTTDYYYRTSSTGQANEAVWFKQTKKQGQSQFGEHYDALGRIVLNYDKGLHGERYVRTIYNELGKVFAKSEPYYWDETPKYNYFFYDILGRTTRQDFANSGRQHYDYLVQNGAFVKKSSDSFSNFTYRHYDAQWREKKVVDPRNGLVTYWYDALGNLEKTRVSDLSGQNAIEHVIQFDVLGRKTKLIDPDIGYIDYKYNAFGHLVEQINSANERTCYVYDELDRPLKRMDGADQSCKSNLVQSWQYDRPGEKGLLAKVTGKDTNGDHHRETYQYNAHYSPEMVSYLIGGEEFNSIYSYDQFNRPNGKVFPTGFAIENSYDSLGFLSQVFSASGLELWRLEEDDARANATRVVYGNQAHVVSSFYPETGLLQSRKATLNGVTLQDQSFGFDDEGNLRNRQDKRIGFTQWFCYDDLNRLVDVNTTQTCNNADTYIGTDYAYDLHGNLTRKDGISDYVYGDTSKNAGPHAVSFANGGEYHYDDAGRMIASPGQRSISYSTFGKPTYMGFNNGYQSEIVYGALQKRIKRTDIESGDLTQTVYVAKDYERIDSPSGREHRHYMGEWGIHVTEEDSGNEYNVYLTRDHIGSIASKSDDLDINAPIIKYHANEPWGRRQDKTWSGAAFDTLSGAQLKEATYGTTRGFTDHEHLDGVGLIHMNGRVYDPVVGRFVSPDPWIQDPQNSQSFNRYSYVWNNPLRHTDPTGEVVWVPVIWGAAKVVGWGMSAYGAYEMAQTGKEIYDDVQSGETTVGEAIGQRKTEIATEAALMVAGPALRGLEKVTPNSVKNKAAAVVEKAAERVEKAVGDLGSKTPEAGDSKPSQELPAQQQQGKASGTGGEDTGSVTKDAARKQVMKEQGIPTSQQPISQSKNASGREYQYEVPKPGGGTEIKSVQQQTLDRSHPGQGHWEAGTVKTDPLTGQVRTNDYGRPKLGNDKSKVDYDD